MAKSLWQWGTPTTELQKGVCLVRYLRRVYNLRIQKDFFLEAFSSCYRSFVRTFGHSGSFQKIGVTLNAKNI